MRLIVDVDSPEDATLTLAALLTAIKSKPIGDNDWRRKPGAICGIKLAGRYFTVRTTKQGWSVRKTAQ